MRNREPKSALAVESESWTMESADDVDGDFANPLAGNAASPTTNGAASNGTEPQWADVDDVSSSGLRRRRGKALSENESAGVGMGPSEKDEEESKAKKMYVFLFCGGVFWQLLLYISLWAMWFRGIRTARDPLAEARAEAENEMVMDQSQAFYWCVLLLVERCRSLTSRKHLSNCQRG
eukprot:SAG11_NODE_16182_length_555_cov_0.684211_1_plen_177_part_01